MTSSRVALTAAFLALAAGGTAACDSSVGEDDGYRFSDSTYSDSDSIDSGPAPALVDPAEEADDEEADDEEAEEEATGEESTDEEFVDEESTDEVFYCADDQGEIVDEDNCDVDDATTDYFLWHSPGYPRGLRPGTFLDGGDFISAGDREARRAFRLPATGKVPNGVVKTNVVGRGSTGSSSFGGDSAGG